MRLIGLYIYIVCAYAYYLRKVRKMKFSIEIKCREKYIVLQRGISKCTRKEGIGNNKVMRYFLSHISLLSVERSE